MPIRESHWYSRNEGGPYPIDQRAVGVDDDGKVLPFNILVDCSLRWPLTEGQRAFVSSWFRSENILSLTFSGCDSVTAPTKIVPLAAVTITKPIRTGFKYPVQPLVPGTGGWVVFGSGVDEETTLRMVCSSPSLSVLSAKAARPYRPWPIPYIKNLISEKPLRGVVRLTGSPPLEVVQEWIEIDNKLRRCLVFRLADDPSKEPEAVTTVFQDYVGPCGKRPESGTCDDPQPIEFVSGVPPDCNGVLTLRFEGCARISRIVGHCGALIDCRMGLRNTCPLPDLPDSEGSIPDVYDPIPPPTVTPGPPWSPGGFYPPSPDGPGVPFSDCFRNGFQFWEILSGTWFTEDDDSDLARECGFSSESSAGSWSSWVSTDGNVAVSGSGQERLLLWKSSDPVGWPRLYSTHVSIDDMVSLDPIEAGLMVNVHQKPEFPGKRFFWAALANWQLGKFRIVYFNGTSYSIYAEANCYGLVPGVWYEISFAAHPGPNSSAVIAAVLRRAWPPPSSILAIMGPFGLNSYGVPTGRAGLVARCSDVKFSFFKAVEAV